MKAIHLFLVEAEGREAAIKKVENFLTHYSLVVYEEILLEKDEAISATSDAFWQRASAAMDENSKAIKQLFSVLEEEGYESPRDMALIPQGYLSKIFHTVAHLLDGFFGVDSRFFNLVEDSHWISKRLEKKILDVPSHYWLMPVSGLCSYRKKREESVL